jgi:Uma2 family endonuclease
MSELAHQPIYFADREAYFDWAMAQPRGRFERIDGEVVAMAPERAGHARIKARVWTALEDAITEAGVSCEAFPDGMTVAVDDKTDYEPDALVNCGQRAREDLIVAPNPVIVVEVLSPGTRHTDTGAKLVGYFRVASIRHYLILNARKPEIVHHHRRADGTVLTSIITTGEIGLDPPGIRLSVEKIYQALVRS